MAALMPLRAQKKRLYGTEGAVWSRLILVSRMCVLQGYFNTDSVPGDY